MDIRENEKIDDLQCRDLKIIQKEDGFRFGVDAVLLADFCKSERFHSAVDLGTGTGIIPILLAGKTKAEQLVGIEIMEDMAEMAQRSIILNGLESRVRVICGDLKNAAALLGRAAFDLVTSNPPYVNTGGGLTSQSDNKAAARHEILCTLDDIVSAAAKLLKNKGQLNLIHRPERLVDIMCTMRKHNIEPKAMRLVSPAKGKTPNLVLIRGFKNGRTQLNIQEPLYLYNEDRSYTDEALRIYFGERTEKVSE